MSGTRFLSVALAALAALVVVTPAAAAAAAPVSRIYAASQHTCLDVATTDPSHYFLDTYGHACDGSTSQAFAFHTLAGTPAQTFEITSESTGQCLAKFRFGIRQQSCTGSVPPDYTTVEWTLQRVGTTGHRYVFVWTPTAGSSSPECVQVYPQPNGYPGQLFDLKSCNPAHPLQSQILALTEAP